MAMFEVTDMGKIPGDLLQKYVFKRVGACRSDVLVGPRMGVDVSLLSANDAVIVAHCDPIVGALKKIGWLAVHIACNDVATAGVEPRWILPTILLPEKWSENMLDTITRDIDSAAKELNVAVVGGHTGYAVGVQRPIVVVTAIGIGGKDEVLTSMNAKVGDLIYITKGAALEGTAILASDFRDVLLSKGVSLSVIEKAEKFMNEVSIVREATALAKARAVTAMHDPTRGGIAEGLIELATASNTIIEVWENKIPVREETKIFAEKLGFDPLWMISSGTLIFTTPKNMKEKAEKILDKLGIQYAQIGIVKARGEPKVTIHRETGIEIIEKPQPERDELATIWEKYARTT